MENLYVISNPAWPGWYKIGKAKDCKDRLNQYNTASPYRDYIIDYQISVENAHLFELHFQSYETSHYEWVFMDLEQIIIIINDIQEGRMEFRRRYPINKPVSPPDQKEKQRKEEIRKLKNENTFLHREVDNLKELLRNTKKLP
jgi:hypothetical protein